MHAGRNHSGYRTKFVNYIGGVTVRDGTAAFTAKTITNEEYVDNELKKCEPKQTVQNISPNVNNEYIETLSCVKIGHLVQVVFSIKKSNTGQIVIASGLPKPVISFIFNEIINGNDGRTVRFEMLVTGELKLNYSIEYTTSQGKECAASFTYLTND